MKSLMTNDRIGQSAKNLEDKQNYMMGFAWVIPSELRLLEAFPNVIMVDTVEKTNNEKRPLLTVGGKDSNGKMFIFVVVLCLINKVGCFDGYLVWRCLH